MAHALLILALRRQRQEDRCELETSLVCKRQFQDSLQSHRETFPLEKSNKTGSKVKLSMLATSIQEAGAGGWRVGIT